MDSLLYGYCTSPQQLITNKGFSEKGIRQMIDLDKFTCLGSTHCRGVWFVGEKIRIRIIRSMIQFIDLSNAIYVRKVKSYIKVANVNVDDKFDSIINNNR